MVLWLAGEHEYIRSGRLGSCSVDKASDNRVGSPFGRKKAALAVRSPTVSISCRVVGLSGPHQLPRHAKPSHEKAAAINEDPCLTDSWGVYLRDLSCRHNFTRDRDGMCDMGSKR